MTKLNSFPLSCFSHKKKNPFLSSYVWSHNWFFFVFCHVSFSLHGVGYISHTKSRTHNPNARHWKHLKLSSKSAVKLYSISKTYADIERKKKNNKKFQKSRISNVDQIFVFFFFFLPLLPSTSYSCPIDNGNFKYKRIHDFHINYANNFFFIKAIVKQSKSKSKKKIILNT